jgi:hypothetical protein
MPRSCRGEVAWVISQIQIFLLQLNGPWQYKLSALYYEPAVTAIVWTDLANNPIKALLN